MAIAVYDVCQLTPTDILIDVVGASVEGGRSVSGITQSIDFSGGGFISCDYNGIPVVGSSAHLYWNSLAGLLNGSVSPIIVPLWTDAIAPINTKGEHPGTVISNVVHSDGTRFSDASAYTQGVPDVVALVAAGLNATVLRIDYPTGFSCIPGQWFSILHTTKNWRAYRISEIRQNLSGNDVEVSIVPPLREAIAIGTPLVFFRPKCLMRLRSGTSMAWHWPAPGMMAMLDVGFVESFP